MPDDPQPALPQKIVELADQLAADMPMRGYSPLGFLAVAWLDGYKAGFTAAQYSTEEEKSQ